MQVTASNNSSKSAKFRDSKINMDLVTLDFSNVFDVIPQQTSLRYTLQHTSLNSYVFSIRPQRRLVDGNVSEYALNQEYLRVQSYRRYCFYCVPMNYICK